LLHQIQLVCSTLQTYSIPFAYEIKLNANQNIWFNYWQIAQFYLMVCHIGVSVFAFKVPL